MVSAGTVDFCLLASFFPKIRESASHFFQRTQPNYVLLLCKIFWILLKSHEITSSLMRSFMRSQRFPSRNCKSRETAAAVTQQQQQQLSYGVPGMGLGLGDLGGATPMGNDAAATSLLASRRTAVGETLTSDALTMLEYWLRPVVRIMVWTTVQTILDVYLIKEIH
jgi:hypothetical protein